MAKLYLKHKEKISKCDESNREINQDIFLNAQKLQDVPTGMLGGIVGGGFGGGVGMGSGFGFFPSQLSMMKSQCDILLGNFSSPENGGNINSVPDEKSSANQQ